MELKEYQQGVLRKMDNYLANLSEHTEKVEKVKVLIAENKGLILILAILARKPGIISITNECFPTCATRMAILCCPLPKPS